MAPSAVSVEEPSGSAASSAVTTLARAAWVASPKSSSFTPDFVSMTLPGFRSL